MPDGPVVLDTNVILNALAARGPPILKILLGALPLMFVGAPTLAELSWVRGRLDPDHPDTARVLVAYGGVISRIAPAKVLVPTAADWLSAGELAGRLARAMAGGGRRIATAFDRVDLIGDSLTALLAEHAGLTIITEDGDFDLLTQLLPGLSVLFYDRGP